MAKKEEKRAKARARKAALEEKKAVAQGTAEKKAAEKVAKRKEEEKEEAIKTFRRKARGEVIMTRGRGRTVVTTTVIKKTTTTVVTEEVSKRSVAEFIDGQMDQWHGEIPVPLVVDFTRASLARVMEVVKNHPHLMHSNGCIYWVE